MKWLLLLRHAKSSWDHPGLADFERPLLPRGRSAAEKIASMLTKRGWLPDHVFVSPARRTRETWAILEAQMSATPETQFRRTLYEASASSLSEMLRRLPEDASTVLVVGHNPGIEDLAKDLSKARSDRTALGKLERKFPTAALARFAVEGKWAGLDSSRARLADFIRPKDI